MVTFYEFILVLGYLLFGLGLIGLISRRHNLVISLVCLEMSILGLALLLTLTSTYLGNVIGDIFFFLLLTLAGVESALGLSLVILYYKGRLSSQFSKLTAIKG